MDWYRRAQEEEEDILGDIVREEMKKDSLGDTVPPTSCVRRLFSDNQLGIVASIESTIILDPSRGSVNEIKIQQAIRLVGEDSMKLVERFRDIGYQFRTVPTQVSNVYGKKKICCRLLLWQPANDDIGEWRDRFWTKDKNITGAKFKSKGWGKK